MTTQFSGKLVGIVILAVLAGFCPCRAAVTWYVSDSAGSDGNTGTNGWSDAKKTIQAAIDASSGGGDLILVTNGTYNSGGAVGSYTLTNRVYVNKTVKIRSVNGPASTFIVGAADPAASKNGPAAIRCVIFTVTATLDGFTLTNGHTLSTVTSWEYVSEGGGVNCVNTIPAATASIITNCVITDCTSYDAGGGIWGGRVFNCEIRNNTARLQGGGARNGVYYDCVFSNNYGAYNGGVCNATIVSNCTIINNHATASPLAPNYGGGAYGATLYNCRVIGNTISNSYAGGGAYCTLVSCIISGNMGIAVGGVAYSTVSNSLICYNRSPSSDDGGAWQSTLYNTLVFNNWAGQKWGAAEACGFFNCTVVGNTNANAAYGSLSANCFATNTIAFGNSPSNYDTGATFSYCCTQPLPGTGAKNITNNPAFANAAGLDFHLRNVSPCIDAGTNVSFLYSVDYDGVSRPRGAAFDIGAYEWRFQGSMFKFR